MKELLILGDDTDVQVQSILSDLKTNAVFFNENTIADFTFTQDVNSGTYKVTRLGQEFKPGAIFWRCVFYDTFSCVKDNTNNYEGYFNLFCEAFPDAVWVNSPQSFIEHQTKLPQLSKVIDMGVLTPQTLITNDIEEALAFLSTHKSVAVKPVCGGDYTQRIKRPKKLKKLFKQHKQPLCLQPFIKGDNVRVFVVGKQAYMSIMPSDKPDFRTHECIPEPLEIDEGFIETNLQIVKKLGLEWTAIDWIKSGDAYYFLEANFSPMFAAYEYYAKQPIGTSLARLLNYYCM